MGILSALGLDSADDGGAADSIKSGLKEWQDLQIPSPEELAFEIERYNVDRELSDPSQLYTGDLQQGDTGLADIAVDPNALAQQQSALNQIGDVATEGITATEQADIRNLMTQESQRQKGAREAIMQNYAERGIAGGGGELASQLLNQQASADRGSQTAFDVAALGKMRALDALSAQGDLSSRIRGQDYGEQASAAQAQDAINAFNINQNVDTRRANFERNYDAGLNRQKVDMANADITTQQRQQTPDNLKYRFNQEKDIAAGVSGQYNALAAQQQAAADAENAALRNTIGTAAAVAGTIYAGPAGGAAAKTAVDASLAEGGPMESGGSYLVGEEGPELVMPREDGEVIPADETSKILESITGMKYNEDGGKEDNMEKMMCNNMNDIQSRLRNLEQTRGMM